MTIIIRNKRVVTYRRYGIPALILEGKWLTALYQLRIGDVVDIEHKKPTEIRLKKNVELSKERQKRLKKKEELKKQQLAVLTNDQSNYQENKISPRGEI